MPRFQFRLQQFLGIKEQIEDQKELEYGRALQKLEEEKNRLRNMIKDRDTAIEELRTALKKPIDLIEIRRFNNNIERLKHYINVQEDRVKAAENFAEEKRMELIQAMKERKALETVRDGQLEEFLRETDLNERKKTDELVSFKYTVREGK